MRLSIYTAPSLYRFLSLIAAVAPSLAAKPSPLQVEFGTQFLGYDGQWSAAQIRVGTSPDQWLQLLPSTISSETWVIGPGGCDNTPTCTSKRGGLFYWNQSQTWDALGYYDLGYNTLSGTTPIGQYGLDNISISDTVSASKQSIAILNTTDIWLGEFGLGTAELRYDDNIQHLSFLSTLVQNESLIPSHSYGYTAGAYYKGKSVSGSLTLGGVDTTRYIPTNVNFTLSETYKPIVAITSIIVTSATTDVTAVPPNWNANPLNLLSPTDAYLAIIDSSTPFLWMPGLVCDAFAAALNLTYDPNTDLYIFTNSSSPELLNSWDLTFTFTLANTPTSQISVNVPISYGAFNLQLSYPFPGLNASSTSAAVNYFPLRRANQTSQYTIGRAFLQESYLTVDYERVIFSVAPAIFPDTNVVSPNIVAITKPGSETGDTGISVGAKIGIAVGVVIVVLLLAIGIFILIRRRKRQTSSDKLKEVQSKRNLLERLRRRKANTIDVSELSGDKRHPEEMLADKSNSRFELDGDTPVEMPADEVSSTYLEINNNGHSAARALNDSRQPAELLADHRLTTKEAEATTLGVRERSESPVPPYYPSAMVQVEEHSDSISPRSPQHSDPFNNSHSSAEQSISPISTGGYPLPGKGSLNSQNQIIPSPIAPAFPHNAGQSLPTQSIPREDRRIPRVAPQDVLLVRTLSRNGSSGEVISDEPTRDPGNAEETTNRRRFSWEEGTTM